MANGKVQIITVCGLIAANTAAVALLMGFCPGGTHGARWRRVLSTP